MMILQSYRLTDSLFFFSIPISNTLPGYDVPGTRETAAAPICTNARVSVSRQFIMLTSSFSISSRGD
eukprot:scaffold39346_cov47-Attheya_sp.AAC.1